MGKGVKNDEECQKNKRILALEAEKIQLKQKLDVLETHQNTLRETIDSKDKLLETSNKNVRELESKSEQRVSEMQGLVDTIQSQRKLIEAKEAENERLSGQVNKGSIQLKNLS